MSGLLYYNTNFNLAWHIPSNSGHLVGRDGHLAVASQEWGLTSPRSKQISFEKLVQYETSIGNRCSAIPGYSSLNSLLMELEIEGYTELQVVSCATA